MSSDVAELAWATWDNDDGPPAFSEGWGVVLDSHGCSFLSETRGGTRTFVYEPLEESNCTIEHQRE